MRTPQLRMDLKIRPLEHSGAVLENVQDRPRARPSPAEGALVAAVALPARFRQAYQDITGKQGQARLNP